MSSPCCWRFFHFTAWVKHHFLDLDVFSAECISTVIIQVFICNISLLLIGEYNMNVWRCILVFHLFVCFWFLRHLSWEKIAEGEHTFPDIEHFWMGSLRILHFSPHPLNHHSHVLISRVILPYFYFLRLESQILHSTVSVAHLWKSKHWCHEEPWEGWKGLWLLRLISDQNPS